MKKSLVFSLVRDQSIFMTIIMSLLTFLSVLILGIAISIGTGVMRWNAQWNLFATVQIMSEQNQAQITKIIDENQNVISSVVEISKTDQEKLIRPWISGGSALVNYLPKMYEIKFKKKSDIKQIGEQISQHAKFLTHTNSLRASTDAGWRMIWISVLVLFLTLGAIGICISYIARNTAMLHKRELEILNQIGAKDSFIAHQMQFIIFKISAVASLIGFISAMPVLTLILMSAHNARVGLMAMMGIGTGGWIALCLLPVGIIAFAIWITKKTTYKILENS